MRLIINLVLLALVAGLVWVLIGSIKEPITFQAEKNMRKDAVTDRLKQLRSAQEIYRDVTGEFSNDYNQLREVLSTGKIMKIAVEGDPDDPNNQDAITYDTTYEAAASVIAEMGINLDSIEYVPFGNGIKFEMFADTMTYQKTLVNVLEAKVPYKDFMGKFADVKYKKYDDTFNPDSPGEKYYYLGFGNRTAPNLSGNWE